MIPLIAMIAAVYGPEPAGRVAETADMANFAGMVLLSEGGKVTLEKGFGTRVPQRMVRARTPSDFLATDVWRMGNHAGTLRSHWQRAQAGSATGGVSITVPLRNCPQPQRVIMRRAASGTSVVQSYVLPDRDIRLLIATTRADVELGELSTGTGLGFALLSAAACKAVDA